MSALAQLLIGITLLFIGIGLIVACRPRGAKTVWFVGNPFLAPMVPIFIIAICAIGLMEVTAYFTTIDEAMLSGAAKPPMR
jgi:hypothetical protein